jgi:hypothetical protein
MNSIKISKTLYRCLWVLAIAGLILNMAAFAESNPLGGNCGDDCTNECDSSCSDCGDCLNCIATFPLARIAAFQHSPLDASPSRSLPVVAHHVDGNLCFDIDHPPQIHS